MDDDDGLGAKASVDVRRDEDAPAKIPINLEGYTQTYLIEATEPPASASGGEEKGADREDEIDDDDDDAVHEHRVLFRCVSRARGADRAGEGGASRGACAARSGTGTGGAAVWRCGSGEKAERRHSRFLVAADHSCLALGTRRSVARRAARSNGRSRAMCVYVVRPTEFRFRPRFRA